MRASEKTLELNVSENILRNIRLHHSSAFLQGITLRNEPRNGLDISIDLTGNASILGLQFKKPTRVQGGVYEFQINNNRAHDQHLKLLVGSLLDRLGLNMNIRYAFPVLYDLNEVASTSPDFISKTFFIDPMDMPYQILDNHVHTVKINTRTNVIHVHSKEYEITNFTKGYDLITEIIKNEKLFESQLIESKLLNKELPLFTELTPNSYSIFKKKWNLKLHGITWKNKMNLKNN